MSAAEVEVDGQAGTLPTAVLRAEIRDRRLQDAVTVTIFIEPLHHAAPTLTSRHRIADARKTGGHRAVALPQTAARCLAHDRRRQDADIEAHHRHLAHRRQGEDVHLVMTVETIVGEATAVMTDAEIALQLPDVAHDHLDPTDAPYHESALIAAARHHRSGADVYRLLAHARHRAVPRVALSL